MRRELKILNAASGLTMFAAGMFGPLYAIFVEEIGGGLITAGTAYGIYAIIGSILIFFISRWEDHIKHKEKLIFFGYLLSCLGFLGYIFIKSVWHLYLVQIIFGIASAIRIPAFVSIYSSKMDKGKYASEWGILESINWFVIGVSAFIGGILAKILGFRSLFMIMLFVSLIGLFISTYLNVKNKIKK